MSDLTGQSLGRYHIIARLGEGGMATVYKAYDTRLETEVAVKVIRTEYLPPELLERTLKRFEREAKVLARLTHANIVTVIDYGKYQGSPYLVMHYLPGGTLKQRLTGKPMPWQEAVKILIPVARALDYAHGQGMVHRDVKPSNILITHSGDPMLTDFGIAKVIGEESTLELTGTGVAVGTPEYMAPEQASAKTVDKRADIYAFGVVLYEMVTGRKPFTADTPMAVLIKQATQPLPRPSLYAPNLPPRLEQVILKALMKDPDQRYQSMKELAQALENLVETRPLAAPSPGEPIAPVPKPLPREAGRKTTWVKWLPIGGAAGLVCIALAVGMGLLLFAIRSKSLHLTPATFTPVANSTSVGSRTPIAATTLTPGVGSTWTRPADGMVMMYVPQGSFEMGSDNGEDNEKPLHTVTLDAYWMDKTEITTSMYALCVKAGSCTIPVETKSRLHSDYYFNSVYAAYPVIYIKFEQADAYCRWAGARLPTEAEWEKAARGTSGSMYPWGEASPTCTLLNFDPANSEVCVGDTAVVGSYPRNQSVYGIFDLAGNAWEWVTDWFGSYGSSPVSNPKGPSSGSFRILRGGSWNTPEDRVRSSFRYFVPPGTNPAAGFGFRCARSD